MKLSARNQFKGTIIDIQEGAVNGIVKIDIGGGNVVSSTISMNAINELGLAVGKEAYAVIKATSVMIGIVMTIIFSACNDFSRRSSVLSQKRFSSKSSRTNDLMTRTLVKFS